MIGSVAYPYDHGQYKGLPCSIEDIMIEKGIKLPDHGHKEEPTHEKGKGRCPSVTSRAQEAENNNNKKGAFLKSLSQGVFIEFGCDFFRS